MLGKDDKETIDKLFKSVDGFRRSAAEQGAVPESADKYGFDASDKLKPYVENFDKDPLYKAARDLAHKAGMTDKVFRAFIPSLLESMIDTGMVEGPVDAKAMLRELAPASLPATATDAEREAAAGRILRDNIAWVDGMKDSKTMPEDVADYLSASAADNLGANRLIGWLRGNREERRPALPGGDRKSETATKEQLDARTADPRNDPNSPKFERGFAEETRRLYQEAHPG